VPLTSRKETQEAAPVPVASVEEALVHAMGAPALATARLTVLLDRALPVVARNEASKV